MNCPTHVSPRVAGAMLPALVAGLASLGVTPASAQQLANWTGAIRCEIRAQAEGYSHQETQVWTLTGAAPTIMGSVTAYPAAWSVVGRGQHDRTRLSTRRVAQWTASVPSVTAPIGFTLQPGGLRFDVTKWHAQLTGRGGYVGTDQFIQSGVSQASQRLEMTVYEWQFPKIEASTSQTQLTGSNTTQAKAFVGPLQPGEAVATVTCTWALGRGSAPAMPPPTLPSADAPVSGAGTPPTSSAGPGPATPPVSTPPASTPPVSTSPVSTPPGATPAPPAAPSSEPLSLALPSGPVTVGISYGSRPALQLGQIAVGSTTTPVSVTLMNTEGVSYGPLYVFGGTPTSAAFAMSQNCQGRTVPVGQSCSVSYTFTPTQAGPVTGSSSFWISTTHNQSDGVNVNVSLSGTGAPARIQP